MVKCSANNCNSSSHKKSPGITFHRFPKSETLRNLWLNNMRLHGWKPKSSSVLCSRHFEGSLLDPSAFCTKLRPGAIPTIFQEFPQSEENITPPEKRVKTMGPALQVYDLPGPSRIEASKELPDISKQKNVRPVLQEVQNIQCISICRFRTIFNLDR